MVIEFIIHVYFLLCTKSPFFHVGNWFDMLLCFLFGCVVQTLNCCLHLFHLYYGLQKTNQFTVSGRSPLLVTCSCMLPKAVTLVLGDVKLYSGAVKQRNAWWNASPLLPTFHPGFAELAMHWSWYHTAGMHNYNWLASKPWKPFHHHSYIGVEK